MFKTAVTKIAHNSTIPALAGNKDLRPLQDLITAEKTVIISLQRLSVDYAKASEALRVWGSGEGDDLGDTLSASTTLLTHFASALSQYAAHGHPMRESLKSIRTREENLDELKRRRKAVSSKADGVEKKLSKMGPEHKHLHMQTDSLNVLRAEIRAIDSDIMSEEAALGDFKRSTTRQWVGLKFGGLLECSETGTIVGEFGKQIIADISEETTQPGMARSLYYGHPRTQSLVSEAQQCISGIQLSTTLAPGPSAPRPSRPAESSATYLPFQSVLGSSSPTTPISTGYQLHDVSPPGGAPPNYLPPQQVLGTGQLLEQSRSNIPAPPIKHNETPPYPQIDAHDEVSHRSIDDFGVNANTSSSGPADGTDGRFATYPGNGRPGGTHGGYAFHDDTPSLGAPHEADGSFSSSVANALGPSHQPPGTNVGRLGSMHKPAPDYDAPMYTPSQGPSSRNATHTRGNPSNASQDDAMLAYTAMDEHQRGLDYQHGQGPDDDRHVRFGATSDVDEEIERRGGPHQPPSSPQQQHAQPSAMRNSSDSAREPPHVKPGPGNISPSRDWQFPGQPPPPGGTQDEERELNAAAAREVSREMDALTFNPPVPDKDPSPDPSAVQHSWGPGFSSSPAPSDMLPLAPPSAPFANRSPSPRPAMDSSTVPPYPGVNPSLTAAQAYAQAHAPSPSLERISLEHNSPVTPMGPRLNSSVPPAIQLPDDGPVRSSPLSTQSPYQTPPEHLRIALGSNPNISTGGSPTPAFKPTPSNTMSPAPRTISAAAFKRPQPRKGNSDLPMMDTSPLLPRKRLPSSPYPQHLDSSSMSRSASLPAPPGNPDPNAGAEQHRQAGDLDEDYDYLSAYVNSGPEDAGSLGPLKVANESGGDGRQAQGGRDHGYGHGGYGNGRFATDLEGYR